MNKNSLNEQHLFEIEIICSTTRISTLTLNQFNPFSLHVTLEHKTSHTGHV